MRNATARAISSVAIWLAVAIVLATGVFQRNWSGDAALMLLGLVVIVVCGSAAVATAAVWRGARSDGESGQRHEADAELNAGSDSKAREK